MQVLQGYKCKNNYISLYDFLAHENLSFSLQVLNMKNRLPLRHISYMQKKTLFALTLMMP